MKTQLALILTLLNLIAQSQPAIACTASFTYTLTGTNTVRFTNTSTLNVNSTWNFGDGSFPYQNVRNPTYSYYYPYVYNVCLNTSDSTGCQSTFCDSVVIPGPLSQQLSGQVFCDSIKLPNWPVYITALPIPGSPVFSYTDTLTTDSNGHYFGFTSYNGSSGPFQQWQVSVYDSTNNIWVYDTVSNCGGIDSSSGYALTIIRSDTSLSSCVSNSSYPTMISDTGWSVPNLALSFVNYNAPTVTNLNITSIQVSSVIQKLCTNCASSPCTYTNIYGNSPANKFDSQYYDRTSGELYVVSKSDSGNKFYVTRLDNSGNLLMMTEYSGDTISGVKIRSLAKAPNGDLLITGGYTNNGLSVIRVNSTGNVVWSKSYQAPTYSKNVIIPSVGDSYIIGTSHIYAAILIRIDGSGNIIWSKEVKALPSYMWLYDLAPNGNGGCVFTGEFQNDPFLGEVDSNGTQLWLRGVDGPLSASTGIMKTADGGYLLSGMRTWVFSFLMKLDANQNIVWVKKSNDYRWHQSRAIEDQYTDIYMAVNTNAGSSTTVQVLKLDQNGNYIWSKNFNYLSNAVSDRYELVSTNSSPDNIILAGSSRIHLAGTGEPCAPGCADFQLCNPANLVWPGDANSDGIANNQDVLAIGIGYGISGFTRPNATNNWVGQPSPDWALAFANGANLKHADCNGDAIIDNNDTLAISLNYGYTHNKMSPQGKATDPEFYFVLPSDSIASGSDVEVGIYLGRDTLPITDFYGIAFTVNYSGSISYIVEDNVMKFIGDTSFAGTPGVDLLDYDINLPQQFKIDIAVTRTDHTNRNGWGKIGTLRFKVKSDLSGKDFLVEQLNLSFSSIKAIDALENEIPIFSSAATLFVKQEILGISKPGNRNLEIAVFPNPTNGTITLQAPVMKEQMTLAIHDALGKQHFLQTFESNEIQKGVIVNLDVMGGNVFFLKMSTVKDNTTVKVLRF